MFDSKHVRCIILSVVLVFSAAAGSVQASEALSTKDLLKAMRKSQSTSDKPAYADRVNADEETAADSNQPAAESKKPVYKAADELFSAIPADSLFVVRINNFEYTLGQIDQFLAGVSPMPMALSMMARMQLAGLMGDAELKGIDMAGDLAIFGLVRSGGLQEAAPTQDISLAALLPISDFELITANQNCSQPDPNGICAITIADMSGTSKTTLIKQAGNFVLVNLDGDYNSLLAMSKSVSSIITGGLAATLDPEQAQAAVGQPIWAYGNVQQTAKVFGPVISGAMEHLETEMKQGMETTGQTQQQAAAMTDVYVKLFEILITDTKAVSLSLDPKPNVLNISQTITAMPGTEMAQMFASPPPTSAIDKRLLAYLQDGALMNFAYNINTPFWQRLNNRFVELFAPVFGENMTAESIAKMKSLSFDATDCIAGPIVCSITTTKNKPPFALTYALEVTDVEKLDKVIDDAVELWNTGGFIDLYRNMGIETSYSIERAVDSYRGVSINSTKFEMKSTDPNSPQGQMIDAMYGGGFDNRWAIVDGLCISAAGADVDAAVRLLIDQAKATTPKPVPPETATALVLIPQATKGNFVGTFNFLRVFDLAAVMMPFPIPNVETPSKSSISFAGNFGNGSMVVDIAVPKQHLVEIMTVFQAMQPQMQQPAMMPGLSDDQLGTAALAFDEEEGTAIAKIRKVDFPQMYGKQGDTYRLPVITRLPEVALEISDGRIEKVVTDSNESLLPEDQWDRKLHFPELKEDNRTVEFDIQILNPEKDKAFLKEISGILEYYTAKGTRTVDTGIIDFQAETKIDDLDAAIKSIKKNQMDPNDTMMTFGLKVPSQVVRSAKFYSEDGAKLDTRKSSWGSSGDTFSITFSTKGTFPPKGRIVFEVAENLQKHQLSFEIRNITIAHPFDPATAQTAEQPISLRKRTADRPAQYGRSVTSGNTHGPRKTVKVIVKGVTSKEAEDEIGEQIKKMIGDRDHFLHQSKEDDAMIFEIAPVTKARAFARKIRFGRVISIKRREIEVLVTESKLKLGGRITSEK